MKNTLLTLTFFLAMFFSIDNASAKSRLKNFCIVALEKNLNFQETIKDYFGQFTGFDSKKVERILNDFSTDETNLRLDKINNLEEFIAYSYVLGKWKNIDPDFDLVKNLREASYFKKMKFKKAANQVFKGAKSTGSSSKKNMAFGKAILEIVYTKPFIPEGFKKTKVSKALAEYVLANNNFHKKLLVERSLNESIGKILRDVTKDLTLLERLEFKKRVFQFVFKVGKASVSLLAFIPEQILKRTSIDLTKLNSKMTPETIASQEKAIYAILNKGYTNSGKEVDSFLSSLYKDLDIKNPLRRQQVRRYVQGGVTAMYAGTLAAIGYMGYKMFVNSENIDDDEIVDDLDDLLNEVMVEVAQENLSVEERKRMSENSEYFEQWREETKRDFKKISNSEKSLLFEKNSKSLESSTLLFEHEEKIKEELEEQNLSKSQKELLVNDLILTRYFSVYEKTPVGDRKDLSILEVETLIIAHLSKLEISQLTTLAVLSDDELLTKLKKVEGIFLIEQVAPIMDEKAINLPGRRDK